MPGGYALLAPVCNLSPLQGDCHGRICRARGKACESLGMGAERSGGLRGGEGGLKIVDCAKGV